MQIQRLKWLSIVIPLIFLAGFDFVRHALFRDVLHSLPGFVLAGVIVTAGIVVFANRIFGLVERMQRVIVRHNAQLEALAAASVSLTSEQSPDNVDQLLQRVVDLSCQLTGTRSGELRVLETDGQTAQLFTSGGKVKAKGTDLSTHTRTLDVPIRSKGRVLGSLSVEQKRDGSEFAAEDEKTLAMFATQAAIAIENARLYQQVQALAVVTERERIAREMHDGMAQVLGYVNTKTQAVKELLQAGRSDAAIAQLVQLENAARDLYADVREGVLALRSASSGGGDWLSALQEYVRSFTQQSDIHIDLDVEESCGALRLAPAVEVQLLRIVQEALTNVRKHAKTRQASVRFYRVGDRLQVSVEDRGQGFNPLTIARGEWPKFGLQTMQERAEAIGAVFELDSSPGRGTRVSLSLPFPGTKEGATAR